jgi:hypothetical protein
VSVASPERIAVKSSGRHSGKTYRLALLVSVGIIVIGVVVAIYGLALESGINPRQLGLMLTYP